MCEIVSGYLKAVGEGAYASAEEKNVFPALRHILELDGRLSLTDDQRGKVRSLVSAMTAETVAIGATLIDQEAALDRKFAAKDITVDTLATSTAAIGSTQAALRNAHLKYHLWT